MVDGVHETAGCSPRSFGGGESRAFITGVSSRVGGENVAARTLLAEPRSVGNKETWATLETIFSKILPPFPHGRNSRGAGERNRAKKGRAPP